MASTAVAVRASASTNMAIAFVDPKKVDYSVGERWLAAQSSGGRGPFAGRQLRFNGQKGIWTEYVNKADKKIKDPTFVLNLPNTIECWQYWPDKEAPSYPFAILPFSGTDAALPSRAECGPEETKYNKLKKIDEDVWSQAIALILRDPETDQLYHYIAVRSARYSVIDFLREIIDEAKRRPGMLPVVKLDSADQEGKDGEVYQKPTFEVVEWVKASAMDNPSGLAAAVAAAAAAEEADEDEPKLKGAKAKSRAVSAPRDEEAEDEEDDEPAPIRKAAASKRPARDEADDEEEDEPKMKGAKVRARGFFDEDDEEEEDEEEAPKPRKRTAARH